MESKNFTYTMDIRLIYLVKKHPCLYKAADPSFRDSDLKSQIWMEIAKSMSKTVSECKTRWRTIRDSYRKNKKKTRSDDEAPSRSKYDDDNLRFLDEVPMKQRRRTNPRVTRDRPVENVSIIVQSTSLSAERHQQLLEEEVDSPAEIFEETSLEEEEGIDVKMELYSPTEPDPLMPDPLMPDPLRPHDDEPEDSVSVPPPVELTAAKVEEGADAMDVLRRDIDERFQTLQQRLAAGEKRTVNSEHPVEIFFRSMASTVMTFSPRLMAEAKVRVCQIISELELRNLSEDPRDWK